MKTFLLVLLVLVSFLIQVHLTAFVEPKPKGVGVNIKVCTAPGNCVKEQAGVILL